MKLHPYRTNIIQTRQRNVNEALIFNFTEVTEKLIVGKYRWPKGISKESIKWDVS